HEIFPFAEVPIPTHEGLPSLVDASNFPSGTRNEAVIIGEQSNWVYYNKPLTLIAIGLLVFLSGIGLSALHLVHTVDVPSALGPVCLSIGLMFFVTGMVWLPIIKHALRHDGLLTGSPTDFSIMYFL
uniref:Uncharacterized protein n=1 Tax=Podarcis muralis TaxID=64176 RepID=A0A670JLH4_PODMU